MADAGEVKAKVIIEYDGSGIEKAKNDLESLGKMAGSAGEDASKFGETLATVGKQAEEASRAIIPTVGAANEIADAFGEGKTSVEEATNALQTGQTAIEDITGALKELKAPTEETFNALGSGAEPLKQLTEGAQGFTEQLARVNEGVVQIGEAFQQTIPQIPEASKAFQDAAKPVEEFAQNAKIVEGTLQDVQPAIEANAAVLPQLAESFQQVNEAIRPEVFSSAKDNLSALQEVMSNPQAYQAMIDHLNASGQSYSDFVDSIGTSSERALGNVLLAQDFINGNTSPEDFARHLQATGQTYKDFAGSIGEANASAVENVSAFNDILSNPEPYNAVSQYLKDTQQSFGEFKDSIGSERADTLQATLLGDPHYIEATQEQIQRIAQARQVVIDQAKAWEDTYNGVASGGGSTPTEAPTFSNLTGRDAEEITRAYNQALDAISGGKDPFMAMQDYLDNSLGTRNWQDIASVIGTDGVQALQDYSDMLSSSPIDIVNKAITSSDPAGTVNRYLEATGQTVEEFSRTITPKLADAFNAAMGDVTAHQQFVSGLQDVSKGVYDENAAIENNIGNINTFHEALTSSTEPFNYIQGYLQDTGQSWGTFAYSIGDANANILKSIDPAAYTDTIKQVNDAVASSNLDAYNNILADPQPYQALQDHLQATEQTVQGFYQGIGPEKAQNIADVIGKSVSPNSLTNADPLFAQAMQVPQATIDSVNNLGEATKNVNTAFTESKDSTQQFTNQFLGVGNAAKKVEEDVSVASKQTGGIFGDLFGEGGAVSELGGGIGGIGEMFGGLMNGFDQVMRPLMYLQMGAQLIGSAGSAIYDANLAAEGPNAGLRSSFTSQVNDLGASAGQGGSSFAVGFGAGLNPTLNAMNYGNAQNTGGPDFMKGAGEITGGTLGALASVGQIVGGGILGAIGLLGPSGNMLSTTGYGMAMTGGEGLNNLWASMTGQPLPFPGPGTNTFMTTQNPYVRGNVSSGDSGADYLQNPLSPYAGMTASGAQAAWDQSHYTGTTGPSDPMNMYEQAIGMRYHGHSGYPVTMPTADTQADANYFNSLPEGPASGPGGVVTGVQASSITQPGGWSNIGDFLKNPMGFLTGSDLPGPRTTVAAANGETGNFWGDVGQSIQGSGIGKDVGQIFSGVGDTMGFLGGIGQSIGKYFGIGADTSQGPTTSTGGGCFPAGTLVLMSDGSEKPIEQIQLDDQVIEHGGKSANVLACITFPLKQVYALHFSNGITLITTDSHPLATTQGWRAISPASAKKENPDLVTETLQIGDAIYTRDTTLCTLLAIETREIVPVYNITVNKSHTYYANKILVHNAKGSMTTSGTGSESVSLSHTFRADVSWEANNLSKSFTAVANWASSNLSKAFTAIANWASSNLSKGFTAIANWASSNLSKAFTAIANWASSGLSQMFTAIANWASSGLSQMFTAVADWTSQNLIKPFMAIAEWAASNLSKTFSAIASWVGSNLTKIFTGIASWIGQNLTHIFVGIAQWITQTITSTVPAFAEGVSNYEGGPALVGEAGPEVIEHGGNYVVTEGPTFVELPRGASVHPMQEFSGSSPKMLGDGTGGEISPIFLGGGGGERMQKADIHVYLDSQAFIMALGVPLSQTVRLGMGSRVF